METHEQQKNREMARMLMVLYLLSLLKKWRVKQEAYEATEREEKTKYNQKYRQKKVNSIISSLMILLGMIEEENYYYDKLSKHDL